MNTTLLRKERKKRFASSITGSGLAAPLMVAALVGSATGISIVGFVDLVNYLKQILLYGAAASSASSQRLVMLVILPAAGLVIGVISRIFLHGQRDQGVPEVLKAIALKSGKIPVLSVLTRAATSILALSSGFSVGREGPAVHIGAGIGSNAGRLFRYSEMKVKNLAACGAAAGISAVFNAPITGVMFALEVLLRDFGAKSLSTVVVASVSSSIISRIFLGESPAFTVPAYSMRSPLEIFLYIGLGILSALTATLFIATLDVFDRLFSRVRIPVWAMPALGGFCVAVIGIFTPQIYSMGFRAIEEMLHGSFTIQLLAALVFVKIIATSISLGSGSTGGTFGPTLFVGAALGGAFGKLCQGRVPFQTSLPGAYAVVGMASVFAGCFHAPVTAILLVFEMTGQYHIILPLMIAAVISASLAQLIRRESIDTVKFIREGIDLEHFEGTSLLGAMQVRDAMSAEFVTVPQDMGVKELVDRMAREKEKAFYTVNARGELCGAIRTEDLRDVLLDPNLTLILAEDVASAVQDICFPEESLGGAAHIMKQHNVSSLPVMDPEEPKKILGILKSEDVFRAYTDIAVKRDELISRMEQEGSHAEGAVHIRFAIPPRSSLAGKFIRELEIPEGVVLTSLQRKNATVIPEGGTQLRVRDRIWAVVLEKSEKEFRAWLKSHGIG